ncbi:MAG: putative pyridoxamine 5'-phosphate oxidase family protein, partial [Marinobacter maritimus]
MSHSTLHSFDDFYQLLAKSLENNSLTKLLLSKYRGNDKSLQRITVRPVILQNAPVLSFVYRHQTNDITKNYSYEEGIAAIKLLLNDDFKSAYLSAESVETQLEISKKGKINITTHKVKEASVKVTETASSQLQHDREKKRFVDINRPFLRMLGVTDKQHNLIPAMSRKWKQINKFIEVFSQALSVSTQASEQPIKVVDFGSGKGYLTFAIHDYLRHSLHNNAQVIGVELRQGLADLCNETAATLDHEGLSFVCGDVKT